MNFIKIACFAGLGIAALTACDDGTTIDDTGPLDTADTGTFNPNTDPLFESIADVTCTGGTWRYLAQTNAWAGAITLDIHETGSTNPWSENGHAFQQKDYDPNGYWDEWDLSLTKVATPAEVIPGSTTLFGCELNDGGSLAFQLLAYNDSNQQTDCAVWGFQPEHFLSQDSTCLNWNPAR